MIVQILITQGNAINALAKHLRDAVFGLPLIAVVGETLGESFKQVLSVPIENPHLEVGKVCFSAR